MKDEEKIKVLRLQPGDVIVYQCADFNDVNWLLLSDMVEKLVGRRHLIVAAPLGTDVVKVATQAAVADEREACARLLENCIGDDYFASKIRARGQEKETTGDA